MIQKPQIKLSTLITPHFYAVHRDIQKGGHTYYDLFGGRGGVKSSFIALEIVIGIMSDPLGATHAAVFRKVKDTVKNSVYMQIEWAIETLQVRHLWKLTKSPMEMVYLPTNQKILFFGLDEPGKIKSLKVAKGYVKYLWFEELDQYKGDEEIRNVQQSVLRGGDKFVVFKSFNPPISKSNWANEYVATPRADALRFKSTYLDVPEEWLGSQFINDAEELKRINPKAYEHEYLGVPVGAGGEVFENVRPEEITKEQIAGFDQIYMGIDWGWYPDPFHWSKMHYDAARRTLYIFDEYRVNKQGNADTWKALQDVKGVTCRDLITADSAEPKSVGDYRAYGSNTHGAVKGPDSVSYGIKWLQSLNAIVIDPVRCPATYKEFTNYEYERTPEGDVISAYPDENNHSIDSVRYAMERVWRRRGR